jgi:isoleucyl-tRNA synthetase
LHRETGELHPKTLEILEKVATRIALEGIEVWQQLNVEQLIDAEAGTDEKSGNSTQNVWFDSGSTFNTRDGHHAVSDGD